LARESSATFCNLQGANLKSAAAELLLLRLSAMQAAGPLHRRLYGCIRGCILDASLASGTRLPASRDLARELGLSRNTVTSAYDQLRAEGYVRALTGSGTFVAEVLPEEEPHAPAARSATAAPARALRLSRRGQAAVAGAKASPRQWGAFMPGVPDVTRLPHRALARIQARLARAAPPALLTYAGPGGHPELQRALAQYLRQTRSVVCEPGQIIVTEGVHQAIDLIVRLLADAGDLAWVEEPGYWGIRSVLAVNGIRLQPLPVDAEGMRLPKMAARQPPRLAFVTPSHQYPLGAVMSMPRRLALLEHAARTGTWVVEDDYDSEFRFSGRPVPALQGLAPLAPVIYVGTFSKTLYPGLRAAYCVVPERLAAAFGTAHSEFYRGGHLLAQAALAEFIASGHYAAHVRRMRQVYAARRQMLIHLIERWLGRDWIHPCDTAAGLHLVLRLPAAMDDAVIARELLADGVLVRPLSAYYLKPARERGLILGFASVPEDKMLQPFEQLVLRLRQHAARR
jgi:GntR family transcriptional regulator/MocR family aminotransferase